MSIQRYAHLWKNEPPLPADNGKWVTYADHLAAVAEAEQRVHDHYGSIQQGYLSGYEQGQRDGQRIGSDGYPMIHATECERQVRAARSGAIAKAVAAVEEVERVGTMRSDDLLMRQSVIVAIKAVSE